MQYQDGLLVSMVRSSLNSLAIFTFCHRFSAFLCSEQIFFLISFECQPTYIFIHINVIHVLRFSIHSDSIISVVVSRIAQRVSIDYLKTKSRKQQQLLEVYVIKSFINAIFIIGFYIWNIFFGMQLFNLVLFGCYRNLARKFENRKALSIYCMDEMILTRIEAFLSRMCYQQ